MSILLRSSPVGLVWCGYKETPVERLWRRVCEFNTLRPRQNGRHFTAYTFKCVFLNENMRISINISLKFVLKGPIDIILSLAPTSRQAISWTNDGKFTSAYVRLSASMSKYLYIG